MLSLPVRAVPTQEAFDWLLRQTSASKYLPNDTLSFIKYCSDDEYI